MVVQVPVWARVRVPVILVLEAGIDGACRRVRSRLGPMGRASRVLSCERREDDVMRYVWVHGMRIGEGVWECGFLFLWVFNWLYNCLFGIERGFGLRTRS